MHRDSPTFDSIHLIRDIGARAVLAIGLTGIGLIHLLDAIGKYNETRYLFWMYIALIIGSLGTAGAVLFTRARATFLAAAGLAAGAAAGYVLSRTTGLPNATGDIGNWAEPLGLASLFVEAAVVAIAIGAYIIVPPQLRSAGPHSPSGASWPTRPDRSGSPGSARVLFNDDESGRFIDIS